MLRDTALAVLVSVRTRGWRTKAGSWSTLKSDFRAVGNIFHLFLDAMVSKEGGHDKTLQSYV